MMIQAVSVAPGRVTAPTPAGDAFEDSVDEEVGFFRHGLGQVTEALGSFAQAITESLSQARPDRVTVEFGCQLGVEPGGLIALITQAGVDANLNVTLEWQRAPAGSAAPTAQGSSAAG
ncbi:CU044_2847 family protein [Streptomyces sp. NPDC058464]|uniref:CU044_2847 family protein n=1 Tax=Streptomyces sp. NPDC058464 TaxID=3346511 RepID=UPI00365EBE5F